MRGRLPESFSPRRLFYLSPLDFLERGKKGRCCGQQGKREGANSSKAISVGGGGPLLFSPFEKKVRSGEKRRKEGRKEGRRHMKGDFPPHWVIPPPSLLLSFRIDASSSFSPKGPSSSSSDPRQRSLQRPSKDRPRRL